MRLLAAVPGSLLWLLDDNAAATRNLRAAAVARGADPARLVFAPRLPTAAHLARHRLADWHSRDERAVVGEVGGHVLEAAHLVVLGQQVEQRVPHYED